MPPNAINVRVDTSRRVVLFVFCAILVSSPPMERPVNSARPMNSRLLVEHVNATPVHLDIQPLRPTPNPANASRVLLEHFLQETVFVKIVYRVRSLLNREAVNAATALAEVGQVLGQHHAPNVVRANSLQWEVRDAKIVRSALYRRLALVSAQHAKLDQAQQFRVVFPVLQELTQKQELVLIVQMVLCPPLTALVHAILVRVEVIQVQVMTSVCCVIREVSLVMEQHVLTVQPTSMRQAVASVPAIVVGLVFQLLPVVVWHVGWEPFHQTSINVNRVLPTQLRVWELQNVSLVHVGILVQVQLVRSAPQTLFPTAKQPAVRIVTLLAVSMLKLDRANAPAVVQEQGLQVTLLPYFLVSLVILGNIRPTESA